MESLYPSIKKIGKNWATILIPLALSIIAFLFYYPSLTYGFIFDDLPTIVDYIYIRVFDFNGQFFTNSRWVSRLFNQFTYKYWQTDPFGYRILDVLLHVTIGALIFFTLIKVFSTMKKNDFLKKYALILATLTTAIFLLHPVQTQTVSYITQMRLEGLVMLFVAATLLTFVHAAKTQNQWLKFFLYGMSLTITVFGTGTKEIMIVAPLLLALFDWFLIAEADWHSFKKRVPFHLLHLVITLFMIFKLGGIVPSRIPGQVSTPIGNNRGNSLTVVSTEKIKPTSFFISQFKVLVHYLVIFIYPFNITFDYDIKLARSFFDFEVIASLALLLSLLFLSAYLFFKKPTNIIPFCLGWFFIATLPRASIFPCTELVCDYKTYLGSLGIMLLLALGILHGALKIIQVAQWKPNALQQMALLSLFIFSLGFCTKSRNMAWSSELNFWKDVVEKSPKKPRAYNNYATTLWEDGKFDESIKCFEKALELDNHYAEPHVNLACIYQGMGDKQTAMNHYQKALEIGEAHPELFHNLAVLHMSNNDFDHAESCFKEAIELKPHYTKAYHNLGRLYYQQRKLNEALACYETAIRWNEKDPELLYSYGLVLHDLGNIDKALPYLEAVDKRYENTAFLLGCCYYAKQNYTQALQNFELACNNDKKNIFYHYNYAQTLLHTKHFEKALEAFSICLPAAEELPFIPLHMMRCLYELGQKDEAISHLKKLVKSTNNKHVKNDGISLLKEFGVKKIA